MSWKEHLKFSENKIAIGLIDKVKPYLTLSRWRSLSYKNQSIDLLYKLMDWFLYVLYDRNLRSERVKQKLIISVILLLHSLWNANLVLSSAHITYLQKKNSHHKHISRLIRGKNRFHHSKKLFESCEILNLYKLNLINTAVFMHTAKIFPSSFLEKFEQPSHSYPTRFSSESCRKTQIKLHKCRFRISIRDMELRCPKYRKQGRKKFLSKLPIFRVRPIGHAKKMGAQSARLVET